jgi:type IV pilus assembly protein PilB
MSEHVSVGVSDANIPQKELLGEILLKRRVINEQQLTHALKVQKEEGGYVGEILIRLGFLEERDIVVALIVQCNVPYIAIDKYEIDSPILQMIPEEIARKYQVVPLDRVGNVLSIVMADPLNVSVKAELQRLTNCQIAPFIATKKEIEKSLDRWFKK